VRYKEGKPLPQAQCSASAFLAAFFIIEAEGFNKEINHTYGDRPADKKIKKEGRHIENLDGCVENMDEWVVHHDDSKNEENNPCFL
jgi:hypothetical protein